jgi:hypothetical protein
MPVTATLPIVAVGRNITVVALTMQAVSAAGLLSDALALPTLVGVLDDIQFEDMRTVVPIESITSSYMNEVATERGLSVTLTEIMRRNETSLTNYNILVRAWANANLYVKLVFSRAGNTYTYYGVKSRYSETLGKEKSTAMLSLLPVSTSPGGLANPFIT